MVPMAPAGQAEATKMVMDTLKSEDRKNSSSTVITGATISFRKLT